jgi:hypothetical protein
VADQDANSLSRRSRLVAGDDLDEGVLMQRVGQMVVRRGRKADVTGLSRAIDSSA